jgi:hypothetical protein
MKGSAGIKGDPLTWIDAYEDAVLLEILLATQTERAGNVITSPSPDQSEWS